MTETKSMMGCGHAANAVSAGKPVCVICVGIHPGAREVVTAPDLTNREACCSYRQASGKTHQSKNLVVRDGRHGWTKSTTILPFFEHLPEQAFDEYYCGCFGWD
jgi:hypothetical protein